MNIKLATVLFDRTMLVALQSIEAFPLCGWFFRTFLLLIVVAFVPGLSAGPDPAFESKTGIPFRYNRTNSPFADQGKSREASQPELQPPFSTAPFRLAAVRAQPRANE